MARLISVNLVSHLENSDPNVDNNDYWRDIIQINSVLSLFEENYSVCDMHSAVDFLSFSSINMNCILNCIEIARNNARMVREIIPSELWESINSFYWSIKKYPAEHFGAEQISDFLNLVKDQSLQFQGTLYATTSRGDAYSFMLLGKYLERAEKMSRILDVYYYKKLDDLLHEEVVSYHYWTSILKSVSGYEAYVRKYRTFIKPKQVVDFLLFDDFFPRSILFCVGKMMDTIMELQEGRIEPYSRELYIILGKLFAELKNSTIEQVVQQGKHDYFMHIQEQCFEIGMKIKKTYSLGEMEAL